MIQITEITGQEIVEKLSVLGVIVDEIGIPIKLNSKWSYHGGLLEGESKFALRLCVDADDRYADIAALNDCKFTKSVFKETYIEPLAAMEFLACNNSIPPGEYLVWCSW